VSRDIRDNDPIVAFVLARYSKRASTLWHLARDRWPLAQTPGLRFSRLLGVGQGRAFDPRADLYRQALFTVWDSYADLKQFEMRSPILGRMRDQAAELWTVHMRPVRWHGAWGGRDPFAAMEPVSAPDPGPWLILTRASIRPNKLRTFWRAVPPVAEYLLRQPELINSVGVGEAPLLYQATISLWRTLPALTSFAYGSMPHVDVIRRTRREQWYREELFARFRPIASSGTWDGIDPLASP